MKPWKAALFGSILAVALPALLPGAQEPAGPGEAIPLSLQDALATAMQENFDVQVERLALQGSDVNLRASYGMYDPQLGLDWSAGVNRQGTTSRLQAGILQYGEYMSRQDTFNLDLSQATPWGESFSLSWQNTRGRSNSSWSLYNPSYTSVLQLGTSLPLLQGFGMDIGNRPVLLAKWDRAAAGEQFAYQLRDTLLAVEESYWNLVYAVRNLEVQRKSMDLAKRFQEETRLKIQAGVLAPIEQIAADAQVANREQDIILAETTMYNLGDVLKLSMGYTRESPEWNRPVLPTDSPRDTDSPEYSQEELIQKALDGRAEIRELEAKLSKDRLNTAWAKNQTLPRLDLVANISYQGSAGDSYLLPNLFVDESFSDAWSQVTGLEHKSWYVGLAFRYPIGNRAARYTYQGYRLQQNSTEILLQKRRELVANEVRSTLRNLKASDKQVAAAALALKLQMEKLDAEEKKFQNGLSTSFQVLTYQDDLSKAATTLLQSKIYRQSAMSNLDKAVGTYLEARGFKAE